MSKTLLCKVCGESVAVPPNRTSVVCPDCAKEAQAKADTEEVVGWMPRVFEGMRDMLADPEKRLFWLTFLRMIDAAIERATKAPASERERVKVLSHILGVTHRS